ncbi:MAG: GHKL domain-containing protein [Sphingobacteriales bacterium]|nr:MAG: GHKL domain-containing protein [Sphingobacteriales bacterium]
MQKQKDQIMNLKASNELLENYFSNTIIPQLFVDADLILRKFTPPAMKQFSLKEDFIGKSMEDIRENFRFPTIIDNIHTVIATGKILEKEVQTTDRHWYQMNILPYIKKANNKANGVIITFVDITPRIRDLKEQEKMVAEQELLLDTIAHDIKNPLLAQTLTFELMKRLPEATSGELSKLIAGLERSLHNIKEVIDGLVSSHWDKQRHEASEELLDFESILEDVRLSLAIPIQENGAIITTSINFSEFKFIRRKLRSILYNLISNAIKYTPSERNPEINVATESHDNLLLIKITDNGIGLSDDAKKSIFEKFKRVEKSVEGTGVGLYLVYAMVTNHGGKIEIDSELGKGSLFKVFIPLNSV